MSKRGVESGAAVVLTAAVRRVRLLPVFAALSFFAWAATEALAGVDKLWIGGNAGLWTDGTKWSPAGVPAGTDRAILANATDVATIPTGSGTVLTHRIQSVDYLVVNGRIDLQDYVDLIINFDQLTWTSTYSFGCYIDGVGTLTTPANVAGQPVTSQILIQRGTNAVLFNQTLNGIG